MTFPTVFNEMKKIKGYEIFEGFFFTARRKNNNKGYEIARLYHNRDNRD